MRRTPAVIEDLDNRIGEEHQPCDGESAGDVVFLSHGGTHGLADSLSTPPGDHVCDPAIATTDQDREVAIASADSGTQWQDVGCALPVSFGLPYSSIVGSDVWVGAATTLFGALLGGAISFMLSRQQLLYARLQRKDEERRERERRSEDRRFQAYSDYLIKARSYRDALQAYYLHANNRPTLEEIDSLLRSANYASSLVFLVVESEGVYSGCIAILKAIWRTQNIIHCLTVSTADDPWTEINNDLGSATRDFQNSARVELGVRGPMEPWVDIDEKSHPDILAMMRDATATPSGPIGS